MKSELLSLVGLCLLIMAGQDNLAQPVPHHLESITVAPDSTITVSLGGSVSNMFVLPAAVSNQFRQMFDLYPLDASSDLASWTRQAILLRTNGDPTSLLWQDTKGTAGTARFYRTPTNYLVTAFPEPSGRYAVGKLARILTDPTRTNRYGIPTNSSFMCTIWYPADLPSAGSLPGLYTDSAVAKDAAFYSAFGWPLQWGAVIAASVTVAYTDVPVVSGTNRFPLIVHSHGYTCDRTYNSQISAELASHGYIVAAVDHIDCHCTVFPDARGTRYVAPGRFSANLALTRSRTNDMEVLLGALTEFDGDDPILASRLELHRIGAMGYSWGGGVAGELSRNDSRISCVAFLDPFFTSQDSPDLWALGLPKPFLTMSDTVWLHSANTPSPADFSNVSSNLFFLATSNAIWFKVANATHTTFADPAWSMDLTANRRSAALAVDAGLLWFFDTYLKGETPTFPTNAEIINLQRK